MRRKQAAHNGRSYQPPVKRRRRAPGLFGANVLAWEISVALWTGRQFVYRTGGAAAPLGGAVFDSEPEGFRYEALQSLFFFYRVPPRRRREVFERFRWIEPLMLAAARRRQTGASGGDS